MKKSISLRTAWALGLALAMPLGGVAQDRMAPPETDLYEPGRALPPVEPGGTLVPLTLDEAIARALEHNLDIQSARLAPQMQEYTLIAARSAFNPTLNTSLGYNNQTSQSTSQLDGGARTTNRRNTLNLSVSQLLPWYGARLSTSWNNARTETDNVFTTRNPSYNSTVSFSYTQPLLSGFRTDNQRNALQVQEIQLNITDTQLLSQIENISDQVRVAYWNLRSQIEQIEIQRQSLEQAQQLLQNNQLRVQLGTLAEIEIVQAEAQVASAEQALLNAEIQWRTQELAFKRLLVGGADDPLLGQTVNPVDLPSFVEQPVDIEAAIATAMAGRTDLQQQRQQRQISELNLAVQREDARPDLSLTASYALQGVGGNLYDRSGLGGAPQLVEQGGFRDGLSSIANFDSPTFALTFNFSYPIGTSAAQANLERAQLQLRQADLALRNQELGIATEVTNAGMAVTNTFLQLEAAQRSRVAAERSAEAELTRFEVGASTNFQVVTAQNALTQARLSELRAIINHVNAIAEFDRVQRVGR